MSNTYILLKIPLNSKYALKFDIIVNIVDNNKVTQIYFKVIKTHFMSKEILNDELLFPEKSPKKEHHKPTQEDYDRAVRQAREEGVGVFDVEEGSPIEVTVFVYDKHGLVELHCQPSQNPYKVYELSSHNFLYDLTTEANIQWTVKGMIKENVRNQLNKTLVEVFDRLKRVTTNNSKLPQEGLREGV